MRPSAENAALLAQEEAAHHGANLLQLTVCNLERAARTADGVAKRTLGAATDQISAASRLHQLLDFPGTERMVAGSYLRMLGDMLNRLVLAPAGHSLAVHIEPAANLALPVPVLRLLGQLVVEAVVNASKHAYPTARGGRVLLTLSSARPWLCCMIADDGIGSLTELGRPGSRGMALIDGLAQQMGGRCRWVFGNQGTEVQVTWPVRPDVGARPADEK